MAPTSIVTAARLRELLHYNPDTGELTWLDTRSGRNARVGCIQHVKPGYSRLVVTIDYRIYMAHRLAWLWMTGEWPLHIDHINNDPLDNRWANLRSVGYTENNRNRRLKTSTA